MHLTKLTILWAIPLAFTLAFGAAPQPAEAQVCGRPGPKKGCVQKKDFKKSVVDSSRVKNNSLKSADIADGSLTGADFQNGGLTGADIQDSGLTGVEIEDGGITAAALAPGVDSDLAAELGCGDDQIARFTGSAWECVTAGASYVFLTSQVQDGAYGVPAWDLQCQTDAEDAGLPAGTYRAWLSTSLSDARDMLPPGPFYRPDGRLVALSKSDLFDERIFDDLSIFADGGDPSGQSTTVWTGSLADGTRAANSMCADWTTTIGQGKRGTRTSTASAWATGGNALCGGQFFVYCVQVN